MSTVTQENPAVNSTIDATDLMAGMLNASDLDTSDDFDPSEWPSWTDDRWELGPDLDARQPDELPGRPWQAPADDEDFPGRHWQAPPDDDDQDDDSLGEPSADREPPAEADDRLTLAGLVERLRDQYVGWDTEAGDLLAAFMGELADRIEATGAKTPADYFARIEIIDRDARDATYRSGFLAGLAEGRACQCQPAAFAFGHDA